MKPLLVTLSAVLVSLSGICQASTQTDLKTMHHSEVAAQIDGVIDEAVWQQATRVLIETETHPADNIRSEVKSVAYMYQNGESLFVAIEAFDPNPEEIRALYRNRDTLGPDDHIGIIIDTFNDQRNAFEFFLNPLGVQADRYKDEVRGGSDGSWNAIWEGAGRITQQGYSVEFEIPFSILRFPDQQQAMSWGIEFFRVRPRDSRHNYSSRAKQRGNSCFLCQIPKYHGFESLQPSDDFQITPSLVTSRTDQKIRLDDEENGTEHSEWQQGSFKTEPGVDVRWGITQDNILNLTLNPDFSQVSADADQISINSSFSPSFPEKRAFFLEGRDSFDTARLNLVHTRRIAAPGYGAKLTGKHKTHNYGLLISDDSQTHITIPGSQGNETVELLSESNIAIGRYRLDVGEQSNLGVLLTHRSAEEYQNQVASLDGVYQWNTANKISYQLAFSDTRNPDAIKEQGLTDNQGAPCRLNPYDRNCILDESVLTQEQQGSAFNVEYRLIQSNYDFRAQAMSYDTDFRADLGNVGQVGFAKALLGGSRKWFGEEGSLWTEWGFWGDWDRTHQQDGIKLEEEGEIYFYLNGPKQWYSRLGAKGRETYWDGAYYDELFYSLYSRIDPVKSLRLWSNVSIGDTIDRANSQPAEELFVELGSDWRFGSHISGTAKVKYWHMDVEGGELYNVSQVDFRVNFQFNLASSLRVVLQGASINKDQDLYRDLIEPKENNFSTQVIYAYEPNPKTLCYIGYTDSSYQNDDLDELVREERSVFMKLSYAFQT